MQAFWSRQTIMGMFVRSLPTGSLIYVLHSYGRETLTYLIGSRPDGHLVTDPAYSPPFELLTSEDDPNVGFYLIDPALIDATYAPQISEADQAQIGARPEDELCLRVIVTVSQVPEDTTINLAAPLVLNLDVGLGCQAILDDNAYGLRVPVIRRQD